MSTSVKIKEQHGRVVLVTGGSRGIGKAIVDKFKREGWTVATCATSAASAQKCGGDLNLVCDVSDPVAVRAMVAAVIAQYQKLDVVINNAGIAGSNSLTDDDDALWHRIIDVNLHGTYYVCKAALPYLKDQMGRVVNIASVLALQGVPDQSAYCAAKHGVLGLTRALAHAVAKRGITVNAICPSWTRTDMATQRFAELGMNESNAKAEIPLGRIIEPTEVAALAWYLCGKDASGITGQALTIDGGSGA